MKEYLQKYFDTKAIHYSLLAKLSWGFDFFKHSLKEEEEDKDLTKKTGMLMGSITDVLITTPKDFDDTYHVAKIIRPSDSIRLLANTYLKGIESNTYEFDPKTIEEQIPAKYIGDISGISDSLKLWGNVKNPIKRVEKFNTGDFWNYVLQQIISKEKVLITLGEYTEASELAELIKTHPFTKKYFDKKKYEIAYQYPIYWTDDQGTKYKILLDMVLYDHENKIIYPIDIKTMSDYIDKFMNNYKRFRYDIQGGLYTYVLSEHIKTTIHKDYTIGQFRFIVGSYKSNYPIVYKMSKDEITISKHDIDGKKGWKTLTQEYEWYLKNGMEYPKEIIEANGEVIIDLNN